MRIPGAMIHRGVGWLPCIPFDTDPMTGEPIVDCGSISDQMPCDAGPVQYPGSGYCPSTPNGYVPELFEQLLGLRGLGRPYWEFEGGFAPIEMVARDNNAPRPSEATIQAVQAQRMRQITGGAIQNYIGGALRESAPYVQPPVNAPAPAPIAVRIVRTPSGRPGAVSPTVRAFRAGRGVRGMGDCPQFQVGPNGLCPDGSAYVGAMDVVTPVVCGNGYVLSNGECVPDYAAEYTAAMGTPTTTPSTSSSAAAPGGCPTGFVLLAGAGVCVPVSSPAGAAQVKGTPLPLPGASTTDWTKIALYGGAALLAIVVVAMVAKR
ncbi:MAG: hypothetical protein IVW54_16540 [Candidatus Binataceae bacterium]|nr:hypothetical protein [Candidatus Binataceae bacterium]